MHTWAEVEAALRARPRWRRIGREWHGPCPVRGIGENACWFAEGNSTPVRGGCRKCGGHLLGSVFREHLDAICEQVSTPRPPSTSTSRHPPAPLRALAGDAAPAAPVPTAAPSAPRDDLPARVWAATEPLPVDGPGVAYLVGRGIWPAGEPVPGTVRWLPAAAAARVGVRPRLPDLAAGALAYLYAGPGEAETWAVQLEAVNGTGKRVAFGNGAKRPAVKGSDFGGGRRVFRAAAGEAMPSSGVWLCEGPVDALAVVHLERMMWLELGGAAVVAAASVSGFTERAIHGTGPVTLALDRDGAGERAGRHLCAALAATGRAVRIHRPAAGDWSDVAAEVGAGG